MLCECCLPDKQVGPLRGTTLNSPTMHATALVFRTSHGRDCHMGLRPHPLPSPQAVGSVELAAVPSAEGALRRSELDAHSATICRLAQPAKASAGGDSVSNVSSNGSAASGSGSGGRQPDGGGVAAADGSVNDSVLLISCARAVLSERAGTWARGVFDVLQPRRTLIVSAMPVCDLLVPSNMSANQTSQTECGAFDAL